MYSKIRDFLNYQGIKYLAPAKAGEDAERMVEYRELGQEARQEFTHLVSDFQKLFPHLKQDRTSQWMNQAQILRPHFWAYLQGEGEITDPMFALRLYGDAKDFGVSLEVSFIERKKDEESLQKQNRVLTIPRDRSQSPETSQRCGNWPGPKGLGKSRCQSIASDESRCHS